MRNNQSYDSTMIEIGAQKSQSGPIAWPNMDTNNDFNGKELNMNCFYMYIDLYKNTPKYRTLPKRL